MFHKNLIAGLKEDYPDAQLPTQESIEHLFSPHQVEIEKHQIHFIQSFIHDFFHLSRTDSYQNFISKDKKPKASKNNAVLMAYDFHINEAGTPKLIEVNTNASGFPFVCQLYKQQGLKNYEEALASLKKSFLSDISHSKSEKPYIVITDEDLENQKMNSEFYIYQNLIRSYGFVVEVFDFTDLQYSDGRLRDPNGKAIDFIYNRYCDFFLDEERSHHLLKAYTEQSTLFSPNPWEYYLLADKERMVELTQTDFLKDNDSLSLRQGFLKSYDIKNFESLEQLLSQRKKLFFKPKNSHGGKSTYSGKSASKKIIERFWNDGGLAQELCPAPTVMLTTGNEELSWKYDIRAYAFKDEMQLLCARLYRGQVTNFNTKGGGFAPLVVKTI